MRWLCLFYHSHRLHILDSERLQAYILFQIGTRPLPGVVVASTRASEDLIEIDGVLFGPMDDAYSFSFLSYP